MLSNFTHRLFRLPPTRHVRGHDVLANDIKEMVDRARKKPTPTNVISFPQELSGLILTENPARPLNSLVVDDILKDRIDRVILEFRQATETENIWLRPSS